MSQHTDRPTSVQRYPAGFIRRVVVKALLLFAACNLVFLEADPGRWLGRLSLYNHIFPGRERLPWSENPAAAYNLSLNNLDAMFASHEIAGADKSEDEYRVVFIGDSSVWGFLLTNRETLTGQINRMGLDAGGGRTVRAYNLGYPTISLTKDLTLLDRAMAYQPDLIVWLVTLEAFPYEKQVFSPLVQNNPADAARLIEDHGLNVNPEDEGFVRRTAWEGTILGERRALADLARLQLYGVMWAATGIDQDIPESYEPRQEDFEADRSYYSFEPPVIQEDQLAFDVLAAGAGRAGEVPVLIVNQPVFISTGENSDIRYNYFYPRWAYDAYRQLLAEAGEDRGWLYLDAWDLVPGSEFTNTAIHLTPVGTGLLAEEIGAAVRAISNGSTDLAGVRKP